MAYLRKPSPKVRQTKKSLQDRTKKTKEWLVKNKHTSCMQAFSEYTKYCTESTLVPIRYNKFTIVFNEVNTPVEPRITMVQKRNIALLAAVQKPNADVVQISQQFQVSIRNITRIAKKNNILLPEDFPWDLAKQNRFTGNATNDFVARQTMNSIARWHKWYTANADTAKHYESYCLYCAKRKKAKVLYKTFAPAFKRFLAEEPVRQAKLAKERARKQRPKVPA